MEFQLLALDLDGTLLEEDLTIPSNTIDRLRRLIQIGVTVTLSTGRMFPSAKIYADMIGTSAPLITYNGAVIRRRMDKEPIFTSYVPRVDMEAVIKFCKRTGYYLQLYNNDQIVVEKKVWQTEIDPDLRNVPCLEVNDFSTAKLGDTPKMMIVTDPSDVPNVHRMLYESVGQDLYIAASQPYLVEMMRAGTSKTSALIRLCNWLQIPREAVICCGDHSNDIDMIEWAGIGAAVGNAIDPLKEKADYTAMAPRSQGVNEIIDFFFGTSV